MEVIIWSKYHCPHCDKAKKLLQLKGIEYEERKLGDGWTKEELLEAVPNAKTVPQIFIDDKLIGGVTDLENYLQQVA